MALESSPLLQASFDRWYLSFLLISESRHFVKYTKMALQAYLWRADTEVNASLCRDNTLASPKPEKRHWDFPNLEIPEAPLHHGGAPLGSSLSRDPRGSSTSRRRFTWTYPTWGSTTSSYVCKKSPRICPSVLATHNTSPRSEKSTYICSNLLVSL